MKKPKIKEHYANDINDYPYVVADKLVLGKKQIENMIDALIEAYKTFKWFSEQSDNIVVRDFSNKHIIKIEQALLDAGCVEGEDE